MNAESIARALGGHRAGSTWMAGCPVHDDREPSLALRGDSHGRVLVFCHAGCPQGEVIAALRSRGLWQTSQRVRPKAVPAPAATENRSDPDDARRSNAALAIWRASEAADGSPVETYLASRGLQLPAQPALRFHPALKHPMGGTWPAMIGLVTGGVDDRPVAIHRTFLARDGRGKAPVEPQKMMLGPCRGGAVRLGAAHDILMVGEGMETCLAVMQAMGDPAWAALSTSGLRTLDLPDHVRTVIVLADNDPPGEAAATACARRWQREGCHVRIARPPCGKDFNDLLRNRTPAKEGGAA